METEIKSKKSVKCTLLFIFIILLLLGVIGYLGYLLYYAPRTQCDVGVVPSPTRDNANSTDKEEIYKKYIEGLSKKDAFEHLVYNPESDVSREIYLTKDNEIYISGVDSDDNTEEYVTVPGTENTIDEARAKKTGIKDVAKIFVIENTEGRHQFVYLLMTNGELHELDTTSWDKTKKIDKEYIMYVYWAPRISSVNAYAVDIDGNEYDI